jgi:hypothetical protein
VLEHRLKAQWNVRESASGGPMAHRITATLDAGATRCSWAREARDTACAGGSPASPPGRKSLMLMRVGGTPAGVIHKSPTAVKGTRNAVRSWGPQARITAGHRPTPDADAQIFDYAAQSQRVLVRFVVSRRARADKRTPGSPGQDRRTQGSTQRVRTATLCVSVPPEANPQNMASPPEHVTRRTPRAFSSLPTNVDNAATNVGRHPGICQPRPNSHGGRGRGVSEMSPVGRRGNRDVTPVLPSARDS